MRHVYVYNCITVYTNLSFFLYTVNCKLYMVLIYSQTNLDNLEYFHFIEFFFFVRFEHFFTMYNNNI